MKLELIPVVRYWDYNPKDILAVLDRFHENGTRTIAAFIPWSHLETDRLHLLQKFVRQAFASGFSLKLGVSPELGIGYSNGGIPDELLRERQNLAQDRLGHPFYACVPPNIHPLVSLLAPQVFQRYGHFLLKLTQELTEVLSTGPQHELELVVSDSLFKHYRNIALPSTDHGDFSLRHMQFGAGYRKEEWTPALAERIFHSRAFDFLSSRFAKFPQVKIASHNLFTRDCTQSRLMEEILGAGPNPTDLFKSIARARSTCSLAWLDDLYQMRDKERNFLISSSLLIYGQLWLNEHDYSSISPAFRKKLGKMMTGFSSHETELSRPAISFVQNRFAPARISTLLQDKLGVALQFKTSLSELLDKEKKDTKLFAVEEGYSLEFRQFMELLNIVRQRDCALVVFRSSLCEAGLAEFRKLKKFRLNHGWLFEIGIFPDGGHVLLVEGQEHSQLSMDSLGDSLISVARIEPFCSFERKGNNVFSMSVNWTLEDQQPDLGQMKTLFLMNPEAKDKKMNIEFGQNVRIHGVQNKNTQSVEEESPGTYFETELPPLSVIPLSVFVETINELERKPHGVEAELA